MPELSQRFAVHPNKIAHWKSQLLERAAEVFGGGPAVDMKALHAKIGQQALEKKILAHALGHVGVPSAR